jgi:hypothetical protein
VLDALRGLAEPDGTVSSRVDDVARLAGLSDSTTRRALAELVDAGCLEPTGERTDGAAVFRLTSTADHYDWTAGAAGPESSSSAMTRDKAEAIGRAWIRNAGLHYDRWGEVEDDLFDEHFGRLYLFRHDDELRDTMRRVWGELVTIGVAIEREFESRAGRWIAAQARKRAGLRAELDADHAEGARQAGELAHRYGGRDALPEPEDVGYCLDARLGDGVAHHAEPGPRYRYGLLLICGECYLAHARNRDAIGKPRDELVIVSELPATFPASGNGNGNGYHGEEW